MTKFATFFGALLLALNVHAAQVAQPDGSANLIQMAILLDASNSMDGLIEQTKSQLWKIVNEMALAKRNGVSPRLEVAFYEYGKDNIPAKEGHLRQIVPLSTDLDRIPEELSKIKTDGGQEYCGRVIDAALDGLQWNPSGSVMKTIFIAGNEPFTQGNVDYAAACTRAIAKGITINTIFCGNRQEGISGKWKDGADLADGAFMTIDQNQQVVYINAPQDDEILKLNTELNRTYLAYGSAGKAKKARQQDQDNLAAAAAPGVLVQRSVAKASAQYDNRSWDLVDAQLAGAAAPSAMAAEELPEEMRKMSAKERTAYVDSLGKRRASIQAKIAMLNKERRAYVENESRKHGQQSTLEKAVLEAVRQQAQAKGYSF
jgi:hypothetical protein